MQSIDLEFRRDKRVRLTGYRKNSGTKTLKCMGLCIPFAFTVAALAHQPHGTSVFSPPPQGREHCARYLESVQ